MPPLDRVIHFLAGFGIAFAVALFTNPIAGVVAALLVGAAKEWVWDAWLGRGNFDPMDLAATVAGGACVIPAYLLHPMLAPYFPH